MKEQLTNKFLIDYLNYVEETETPRLMHVWSVLSGIAACLGRRNWFPFGIGNIYPNQYLLLVGPPGVRKSTSINIVAKLLRECTEVRFAPDDTCGQRQGLIKELSDPHDSEDTNLRAIDIADMAANLDMLGDVKITINGKHPRTLYISASEFATIMGQNSPNMVKFLTKMYDGEDYKYQLKNENVILKEPLLNMIGATTPTDLADILPPRAIGQGFTSRVVFIYANKKYKRVPRPPELDNMLGQKFQKIFAELYYNFEGPFREDKAASQLLDKIYQSEIFINDPRFIYYCERRHTHLLKLTMALAASRLSKTITVEDVEEANKLLIFTEQKMPEALGEFGLSPLAAAKQKMVEFLQHANGPVTETILWAVMQRDMKIIDFKNSLSELVNGNKIYKVTTKNGSAFVYVDDMHGYGHAIKDLMENDEQTIQ
jgi:hypothetical protein